MTDDVRARYDAWHASYAGDSLDAPWHQLVCARLAHTRFAGQHLLEIGCGRGAFAGWLATREVPPAVQIAADFSTTALAMAQRVAPHAAIRWLAADAMQLPLPPRSLDVVVSCETIEHVPDSRGAIAEFARVLVPGGRLLLTCPNYLNATGAFRGYLRTRGRRYTEGGQPINHPLVFCRVRQWVRQAGFRIVFTRAVGHYLPFPGRSPIRFPALDTIPGQRLWEEFALHTFIEAVRV
jgi:SAM-dependent methyltransferase